MPPNRWPKGTGAGRSPLPFAGELEPRQSWRRKTAAIAAGLLVASLGVILAALVAAAARAW